MTSIPTGLQRKKKKEEEIISLNFFVNPLFFNQIVSFKKILIECLPYARYFQSTRDKTTNKIGKDPCPHGAYILLK